jgi:4,5-DOPA dioxygenase extradiol
MRMPVLFLGHGSPLNAIEDNDFSRSWSLLGEKLGKPKAILALSAHWPSRGLFVNREAAPKQIYDMVGFPNALYDLKYPAHGDPLLAKEVTRLTGAKSNDSFGIDHGVWSLLCRMYPEADVPVVMLSLDIKKSPQELFELGVQLQALREEGVLILCSGNVVHNLYEIDWDKADGFAWADRFDEAVKAAILSHDKNSLLHFMALTREAGEAIASGEHFLPLLVALGAAGDSASIQVINDKRVLGSLSMTSYLFA